MTPPSEPLYAELHAVQSIVAAERKVCLKCGEDKPLSSFPARKDNVIDGRRNDCRKCRNAYQINRKKFGRTRISTANLPPPSTKLCTVCRIVQSSLNFSKKKKGKYGLSPSCKTCCAKQNKRWRNDNPDKCEQLHKRRYDTKRDSILESSKQYHKKHAEVRNLYAREWRKMNPEYCKAKDKSKRFSAVGIDEGWYNAKLSSQGGGCAICGATSYGKGVRRFHVDHDHECCPPRQACDKCRRGVLCAKCNHSLAQLEDKEWMARALAYLELYKIPCST